MFFAPLDAIYRPSAPTERTTRVLDALGVDSGLFDVRAHASAPVGTHRIDVLLESPAQVDAFRTFLAAVRGRWKPVWLPSYQEDFVLVEPIATDDLEIVIQHKGYAEYVWPTGAGRRYLAFILPDGQFYVRYVEAAVDNGDGTETLTLDSELGGAFAIPQSRGMVSYLWYCRLDADNVLIAWFRGQFGLYAEAQVTLVDLVDAPVGGGGGGGGPGNPPEPPCVPGSVLDEDFSGYPQDVDNPVEFLAEWPVVSGPVDLCGGYSLSIGGFSARVFACGTIGVPGSVTHRRTLFLEAGTYEYTAGPTSCSPPQGLQDSGVSLGGVVSSHVLGGGGISTGTFVVPEPGEYFDVDIFVSVPYNLDPEYDPENPGTPDTFGRQLYTITVGGIQLSRIC